MAEPPQSEVAPDEPTRPETIRQPATWAQSQSLPAQEQSAVKYNEAAQQHMQKQWDARQQPEAEAKQPEKAESEQVTEKQKAIQEAAQKLATQTMDQERGREQER
jgi:hypothetical protein